MNRSKPRHELTKANLLSKANAENLAFVIAGRQLAHLTLVRIALGPTNEHLSFANRRSLS